jgi:formylglycine-generating enzyme required for sulfatase activity
MMQAGFWVGQTPVTQAAYEKLVGTNPSYFKGSNLPVENVSWTEAESYCKAAGMRLPTEAQWEYAARAGTTGSRYGNLDEIASYGGNSGKQTHPVGTKAPNAWKLYDMLGNVWQWMGMGTSECCAGAAGSTPPKTSACRPVSRPRLTSVATSPVFGACGNKTSLYSLSFPFNIPLSRPQG